MFNTIVFLHRLIFHFVMFDFYLSGASSFLLRFRKGVDLEGRGGEKRERGTERRRGRGSYSKNVMYDKRIYLQKRKRKKLENPTDFWYRIKILVTQYINVD